MTVLGLYEDEDLLLVNPTRLESAQADARLEYAADAEPAEAEPAVGTAPAVEAAPAAEEAAAQDTILEVLGYRRHLGNEQWRVRWAGHADSAPCETWERWDVLGNASLSRTADEMRTRASLSQM